MADTNFIDYVKIWGRCGGGGGGVPVIYKIVREKPSFP